MKKLLISLLICHLLPVATSAQTERPFKAYLTNEEYEVYLRINLYEQNIQVPGQELYGELLAIWARSTTAFAGSSPRQRSAASGPACS